MASILELLLGALDSVTATGEPLILLIVVLFPALSSAMATSLVLPSPPSTTVSPELGLQAHPLKTPLLYADRPSLSALTDVLPPNAPFVPTALFGFVIVLLFY
jgi:hypothetical protein